MSEKKNKNQHYVSAFYLYNFTNNEQRKLSKEKRRKTKIWHYDKEKMCIKERSIENIATESYLFSFKKKDGDYDHFLDEKLCEVEDRAVVAFNELCEIKASFKKSVKSIQLDNSIMDNILTFVFWQMKRHPSLVVDVEQQCKEWIEKNELDLIPKEMALYVVENIGNDKNSSFENIFQKKNKFILFTTNSAARFITTDVPLVRFNKSSPNGIGIVGTEIYFPLASNMLLCMCGDGDIKEFRRVNDRLFIRDLNNFMAKNAKNYVFGESEDQLSKIVRYISK